MGAGRRPSAGEGTLVIRVTRLDGSELFVNAEFVQSVESTPDTHVILIGGHSYVVTESDEEVVARIIEYRRAVAQGGTGAVAHLKVVDGRTE